MSRNKLEGKPKLPKVLTYMVASFRTWLSAHPGRIEGGMGGTIPRTPNHYWGAEWLRGTPKSPNNVQVLSSIQWICFRKTSGSNIGAPNLRHLTSWHPCQCLSCWFMRSLCEVCNNAIIAKHCELERHNWQQKHSDKTKELFAFSLM